jgi:hypothetical protein
MKTAILGVAGLLLAASTASADVQLTMHDGRVSLVAKDATVRQILTEWARIGQTKIVNVERIPGGPVTLELSNVPEAQALEILLRTLSGYITAPRPVEVANLSRFDRIIIMPTLASARPAVSSAPPPAQAFVQPGAPQFNVTPTAEDDSDDARPAAPVPVPAGQRGPVFNTFPQPQVVTPQNGQQMQPGGAPQAAPAAPVASPTPVAPYGGVSVPGMVAPPPPAPAGQQQPGAPAPVRRPGGPGGEQR